jgi:hypothetical protein
MDNVTGVDGLVKSTLLSLGVPVERLFYKGKAETYITFQYLHGQEAAHADDDSTAYEHSYRADIFSRSDYIALLRRVERALKSADFYGITVDAEIYEKDTGYYHIPIEFYFMEE